MFLIGKSRRRWFILAGVWLVIMILGVGGYAQQARANGMPSNPLDTLYQTLQLAALQFKGDTTNMNWRLQVVRFAALLMAAGTLISAASVVFAEQLRRWGAAGEKGHTVVVGSGEVGRKFVAALRAGGHRVVAVTESSTSARRRCARCGSPWWSAIRATPRRSAPPGSSGRPGCCWLTTTTG
jgi:hypothetical protein